METLKRIFERIKNLDKKKRTYLIAALGVVLVMCWAFMSAIVITGNYSRAQLKGSADEQKVDATGIIITETKDGDKYFEIYGETGHYSNDHSIATLNNVIGNFYKENNRIDEPLFKLFYAMALLNIGEKHPYYDMAYDILQNIKPEIQKIKDKTIENYSLYEEFNLYNKNFYLNLDEILAAYHCDFMLFYYVLPQKATKDLYLSNADSANKYISTPRSKFYYLKILLLTRMKNYFNLGIEENINKEIEEFKIAFKNLKEHERNYYKATYNQMLEIFSSAPYKINE